MASQPKTERSSGGGGGGGGGGPTAAAAAMSMAAVTTLRGLLRKAKLAASGGGGVEDVGPLGVGAEARSRAGSRATDDDGGGPGDTAPAVGFRVRVQGVKLTVTVLGARHLPARLPAISSPATGYVVKVKMSQGATKYETEQQAVSWPTFNESFVFPLGTGGYGGRFVMLTVYAVDELRRRKAVGAVTWSLDGLVGQGNAQVTTPDIWRRLHDVRGSVLPSTPQQQQQLKQQEARRNQVEVSLRVAPGSAGEGEAEQLELTVLRLRWSLQATREYEQKKAQLYVKLSFAEGEVGAPLTARKTKPFAPNIAVHFDAATGEATVRAALPPPGPRRDAVVCRVALCTKPSRIGKKVVLGRAVFGTTELSEDGKDVTGHLARALQEPGRAFTQWHSLR